MNDFFIDRHTTKPIAEVVHGLVQTKVTVISDGEPNQGTSEIITPAFTFKGLENALTMVEKGLGAMDTLQHTRDAKIQDVSDRFGQAVQKK